ncbi:ATP-dependent helicase [Vibrio owensii]|uniref:ATP-dependent helicase n=1 Tax=Vibrio harveyi group TaxID=717610 RepID=UPI003CC6C264
MLNQQQKVAVTYDGKKKNVLVLAGAGCGKTTTIIERIAHLIESGYPVNSLLLLTFTNRAANEMKNRLKKKIGVEAENLFAGTFHKLGLVVLSKLPKSFGINGLTIIDQDDQNSLMGLCRSQVLSNYDKKFAKLMPSAAEIISIQSYSVNTCQPVEKHLAKVIGDQDIRDAVLHCCAKYQAKKAQKGYLDYDDLLVKFAEGMESSEELRVKIAQAFKHVLVDEFQDTNKLQFRILKCLTAGGADLYCVGDDAQSIYAFRGAEFEHTNRFSYYFEDAEILPLTTNYRSNQEILDVSNWLLDRSPLIYDKKLFSDSGLCGKLPQFHVFDDEMREAFHVVDEVETRKQDGVSLNDMAVIVPTSWSAKAIEGELARRRIPYRFIGGTALSKSAHIRDVMSLLKVVANNDDELGWLRYLTLFPRVGEKGAAKVIDQLHGKRGEELLSVLDNAYGPEHLICQSLRDAMHAQGSPQSAVNVAVKALTPLLKERYKKWNSRSHDLKMLSKIASKYQDLESFLTTMTLDPISDSEVKNLEENEVLTLITVHSAKGTEYDVTFVCAANPGMYPHTRSLGNSESEEEQRRVLYVALTRAKKELHITRSQGTSFTTHSIESIGEPYFLSDVPEHLVDLHVYGWNQNANCGGLNDLFE